MANNPEISAVNMMNNHSKYRVEETTLFPSPIQCFTTINICMHTRRGENNIANIEYILVYEKVLIVNVLYNSPKTKRVIPKENPFPSIAQHSQWGGVVGKKKEKSQNTVCIWQNNDIEINWTTGRLGIVCAVQLPFQWQSHLSEDDITAEHSHKWVGICTKKA